MKTECDNHFFCGEALYRRSVMVSKPRFRRCINLLRKNGWMEHGRSVNTKGTGAG